MSSTSLADLEKLNEEEQFSSRPPTLGRNSLDIAKDEEKSIDHASQPSVEDNPPPLSTVRLALLMTGLCLSMFLVALDFVYSPLD